MRNQINLLQQHDIQSDIAIFLSRFTDTSRKGWLHLAALDTETTEVDQARTHCVGDRHFFSQPSLALWPSQSNLYRVPSKTMSGVFFISRSQWNHKQTIKKHSIHHDASPQNRKRMTRLPKIQSQSNNQI